MITVQKSALVAPLDAEGLTKEILQAMAESINGRPLTKPFVITNGHDSTDPVGIINNATVGETGLLVDFWTSSAIPWDQQKYSIHGVRVESELPDGSKKLDAFELDKVALVAQPKLPTRTVVSYGVGAGSLESALGAPSRKKSWLDEFIGR